MVEVGERDTVDVEEMLLVWVGVWDSSGLRDAAELPDTVSVM